jgi:hypothetical protein
LALAALAELQALAVQVELIPCSPQLLQPLAALVVLVKQAMHKQMV